MSEIKTHYRTCNICEAMCGLEIKYQGKEILSIKGDKDDPLSRGHICPKAVALQDFYDDPDRLKRPLKKTKEGWKEISWEEALDEAATKLKAVQGKYGKDAVGVFLGNPNAHKVGNFLFLSLFVKALGSRNRFSATSVDQLPHHFASHYMLGHGGLLPVPDIDRTDYMLIIGANPLVSNGSLMTCPDFGRRMKAIMKRGGKVIVIDPRKTETAKKASEHFFIQPETDALLLMAMIHTIFEEGLENLRRLETHSKGLDRIRSAAKDYSPELAANQTGIPAAQIRKLALNMAKSERAVCYSRMGASTQSFGGLNLWLTYVLNIITGNFDREGGAMFTEPAFDLVKLSSRKHKPDNYGKFKSRVWGFPLHNGEFPAATIADEILTPGEGQIKAMITIAGNPILSTPNGGRMEKAFESLEYFVAVDIYISATSRYADLILPGCASLEVGQYDVAFHNLAIRNTVKYAPPLFEKGADQRYDWEILRALAARLTNQAEAPITPEMMLDAGFQRGAYKDKNLSVQTLSQLPHGMDLGPLRPCLLERIETKDDKIDLAPAPFIQDLPRLKASLEQQEDSSDFPFRLIGRRLLRQHNTWTQNSYRLIKGKNECTLMIHPEDAARLQIQNGEEVVVRSKTGVIHIEVEISDDIAPGVVSIPQGWGHGRKGVKLSIAQTRPGVSINDLTDHRRIDTLTGNAAVNGVRVSVGG